MANIEMFLILANILKSFIIRKPQGDDGDVGTFYETGTGVLRHPRPYYVVLQNKAWVRNQNNVLVSRNFISKKMFSFFKNCFTFNILWIAKLELDLCDIILCPILCCSSKQHEYKYIHITLPVYCKQRVFLFHEIYLKN